MITFTVLLVVAAVVLSGLALFKSNGKSELAWAVLCLALVHLLPVVR